MVAGAEERPREVARARTAGSGNNLERRGAAGEATQEDRDRTRRRAAEVEGGRGRPGGARDPALRRHRRAPDQVGDRGVGRRDGGGGGDRLAGLPLDTQPGLGVTSPRTQATRQPPGAADTAARPTRYPVVRSSSRSNASHPAPCCQGP